MKVQHGIVSATATTLGGLMIIACSNPSVPNRERDAAHNDPPNIDKLKPLATLEGHNKLAGCLLLWNALSEEGALAAEEDVVIGDEFWAGAWVHGCWGELQVTDSGIAGVSVADLQ